MNAGYYCNACGNQTRIALMKGNGIVELALWLLTFFGGMLYSIWRRRGPRNTCPVCKTESLIPAPAVQERFAGPSRQEKECPHCAELILSKAKVCKHCGQAV